MAYLLFYNVQMGCGVTIACQSQKHCDVVVQFGMAVGWLGTLALMAYLLVIGVPSRELYDSLG